MTYWCITLLWCTNQRSRDERRTWPVVTRTDQHPPSQRSQWHRRELHYLLPSLNQVPSQNRTKDCYCHPNHAKENFHPINQTHQMHCHVPECMVLATMCAKAMAMPECWVPASHVELKHCNQHPMLNIKTRNQIQTQLRSITHSTMAT